MAIKVLKQGVIPPPIVYTGKCRRCQCEFECGEEDMLDVPAEYLGCKSKNYTEKAVPCPTCGATVSKGVDLLQKA